MAEQEVRHPDGRIEHPHVRHERTDARFRPILIILIAALVLAVVIHVAVYAFFRRSRAARAIGLSGRVPSPASFLTTSRTSRPTPEPSRCT